MRIGSPTLDFTEVAKEAPDVTYSRRIFTYQSAFRLFKRGQFGEILRGFVLWSRVLEVERWQKIWLTRLAVQRQIKNGVRNEPLLIEFI